MTHTDYVSRLRLDERELASRRAFFEIEDVDLARLASLRPLAEKHGRDIVEDLYELLLDHAESRAVFADDATIRRVKALQHDYFLRLFAGVCDFAYVQDRLRVGETHERIGLAPKWYIGAYSRYLRLLLARISAELSPAEARAAHASVTKMVAFDMSLAIDTYIAANLDTVARHRATIRELSTPVIRIHQQILLSPLVGVVDSQRAAQVMDTLLAEVTREQARAVIIDIAGVATMDTEIARHLLDTTAAVRLLGAETIVTGVSTDAARTVVQLGVDLSTMHTRSRLSEGLEFALELIGRRITAKD